MQREDKENCSGQSLKQQMVQTLTEVILKGFLITVKGVTNKPDAVFAVIIKMGCL